MTPTVIYQLTESTYNQYQALLSAQGITAVPKSREIFELLETHEIRESIHGALHFKGDVFPFSITKQGNKFSFEPQPFEAKPISDKEFFASLLRAFPQPTHVIPTPRPLQHIPQKSRKSLITEYGCFLAGISAVTIFIILLVFAVIGVRSLFR